MNHGKGTYCEVYNPEITLLDRSGDASHPVWVEKRQAPGTWIELCLPEYGPNSFFPDQFEGSVMRQQFATRHNGIR